MKIIKFCLGRAGIENKRKFEVRKKQIKDFGALDF